MGERRAAVEANTECDLADREIGCLQQFVGIVEADPLLEFSDRRAGPRAEQSGDVTPRNTEPFFQGVERNIPVGVKGEIVPQLRDQRHAVFTMRGTGYGVAGKSLGDALNEQGRGQSMPDMRIAIGMPAIPDQQRLQGAQSV